MVGGKKCSYADIYQKLLEECRSSTETLKYLRDFVITTGVFVIGAPLVFGFGFNDWETAISGGVELLLLSLIMITIAFLYVVARVGSQDPMQQVAKIAAQLLIAIQRPYVPSRKPYTLGLAYKDIQKVQELALLEQGSADWRGSFVTVVILGLLALLFRDLNISEYNTSETMIREIFQNAQWLKIGIEAMGLAGITGFALILIWRLGRYYFNFFTTEPANRMILFACAEALALLERAGLQNISALSLAQKQVLIQALGYRLVSKEGKEKALYVDELGKRWLLELDDKLSKNENLT